MKKAEANKEKENEIKNLYVNEHMSIRGMQKKQIAQLLY